MASGAYSDPMDRSETLYRVDAGVGLVTLNRPEIRNALTGRQILDEIITTIETADASEDVTVLIITGEGSAFSAGGNVKDMRDKKGISSGNPFTIAQGYLNGIQRIPLALHDLDVPTIAAVNGPAIGAGCDLACMCDIRIAAESASFAESFIRVGIVPGDGGAFLLPRAVGMSKAAEMSFTGDAIDASDALACGLVSRVVPDDKLMEEARALAARIARNPGPTLRMTKRLLREGQHAKIDTLLEMSAGFQAIAHKTPQHKEAVMAFIEKRKPVFTDD